MLKIITVGPDLTKNVFQVHGANGSGWRKSQARPTPRDRVVAPYAVTLSCSRNFGTDILIPVTNPRKRLNKEVKRRADVVGIFPNEDTIICFVGAVLLEQNDEWQLQHR